MKSTLKVLTKKGFTEWAESKMVGEIIGEPAKGCHCPIFRFLASKGVKVSYVSDSVYVGSGVDEKEYKMPKWGIRFIETLDEKYSTADYVTKEEVLPILGR